jgi:hypothetical protein
VRLFWPRSKATSSSAYLSSSNTPRILKTNFHCSQCNPAASLTPFAAKEKLTHFGKLSTEHHVLAVSIEERELSAPPIV